MLLWCGWVIGILCVQHLWGCILNNQNQFYMMWRFLAIAIAGLFVLSVVPTKENRWILLFSIIPSFLVLGSVLIMTNMDVNTSAAKMFVAIIGLAFAMFVMLSEYHGQLDVVPATVIVSMTFLVIGFLCCKLLLIRVSGCLPVTVLAPMERIMHGPAKGIYVLKDTATVLEEDYAILSDLLTEQDKLLYVGCENIVYLWTKAGISTPSTQGTNAFNHMFTEYYEIFPEKMPTMIVVDKELGSNPVYYNSPQNHILFDWIETEYDYCEKIETNYMTIYIKNK